MDAQIWSLLFLKARGAWHSAAQTFGWHKPVSNAAQTCLKRSDGERAPKLCSSRMSILSVSYREHPRSIARHHRNPRMPSRAAHTTTLAQAPRSQEQSPACTHLAHPAACSTWHFVHSTLLWTQGARARAYRVSLVVRERTACQNHHVHPPHIKGAALATMLRMPPVHACEQVCVRARARACGTVRVVPCMWYLACVGGQHASRRASVGGSMCGGI